MPHLPVGGAEETAAKSLGVQMFDRSACRWGLMCEMMPSVEMVKATAKALQSSFLAEERDHPVDMPDHHHFTCTTLTRNLVW